MLKSKPLIVLVACLFVFAAKTALAQPGNDNASRLDAIRKYIAEAGDLYKKNEFVDSGKKIRSAQALLERVVADAVEADRETLMKEYSRIAKAHELLGKENVKLPALAPFPETLGGGADRPVDENSDKDSSDNDMNEESESGEDGEDGTISFKSEVAPLLVRHCGNCHVRGAMGRYSIATFDALMAASGGKSVVNGKPAESLLVTKIEDGSMPKRGPKVKPADLDLIKKWIEQGAEFDGDDRQAPLDAGKEPPGKFR